MTQRMPSFNAVFDRHAIALGRQVFRSEARSPDSNQWHRHLFHLRADVYRRLWEQEISLDSIGVSEWEVREAILVSGNDHIKSILAGNHDGEEDEYDVARELLLLGFSPSQIFALPLVVTNSISKDLR